MYISLTKKESQVYNDANVFSTKNGADNMNKPILAITMGDPAGIGPEISLKALTHKSVYESAVPIIIGDAASLEKTKNMQGVSLPDMNNFVLSAIASPNEAVGAYGTIEYIDLALLQPDSWKLGEVSKEAGEAAFRYVEAGIQLALKNEVDADVTAPINKEAIQLAGHHFPGHTEIFSHYCGIEDYAMILVAGNLRVIHVTTHMSMRNVCDAITYDRVLATIRLAKQAADSMDVEGTIAVAGFNPHSSENGLFGDEESRAIIPAIAAARKEGIDVDGPVPPDTVFVKALAGKYAVVVAMYHDQGHIPVKLAGFHVDEKTGRFTDVSGINCTIGLPIIRTSVDHGTAFDVAGKGIANEQSMLDALEMACKMARKNMCKKAENLCQNS
jgi:4-hydroxythreonine-4-phosphate dehydrogenase